nr:MAG TPA: hypothetical protein [Caudoviricetes sp.]
MPKPNEKENRVNYIRFSFGFIVCSINTDCYD